MTTYFLPWENSTTYLLLLHYYYYYFMPLCRVYINYVPENIIIILITIIIRSLITSTMTIQIVAAILFKLARFRCQNNRDAQNIGTIKRYVM